MGKPPEALTIVLLFSRHLNMSSSPERSSSTFNTLFVHSLIILDSASTTSFSTNSVHALLPTYASLSPLSIRSSSILSGRTTMHANFVTFIHHYRSLSMSSAAHSFDACTITFTSLAFPNFVSPYCSHPHILDTDNAGNIYFTVLTTRDDDTDIDLTVTNTGDTRS